VALATIKGMIFGIWIKLQNSIVAMRRNTPNRIKKLSVENSMEDINKII
jgi:hypothetical protein